MFFSLFLPSLTPSSHPVFRKYLLSLQAPLSPKYVILCSSSLHPSLPFRSPRSDFSVFPISDYFPPSAHFAPPPPPVVSRSFLQPAFNNICQSLTSSPLFSLRCVWSLTLPPTFSLPVPLPLCFASLPLTVISFSLSCFTPVFIIHNCNLFHQAQAH